MGCAALLSTTKRYPSVPTDRYSRYVFERLGVVWHEGCRRVDLDLVVAHLACTTTASQLRALASAFAADRCVRTHSPVFSTNTASDGSESCR